MGNGFVVEAVNSAIQVRSTAAGAAITGVRDLNTFFGYPAAIDRATGVIGPQVIDPVCLYDPDNNRFVVALTTLGSNPDGSFTGKNTIDVAVSNTGDPTGAWTIYSVPAQNDGTDGTPDHGCKDEDDVTHGPCFQDYPHLGADANGIYISTNEYDLFGPGFNAAQVFAFSKDELARHPASVRMTLVENLRLLGTPGWTVWPATSPAGEYSTAAGGTEFLLSTVAGDGSETGNPTGTARRLGLWALTNTSSLDTATPDLSISSRKANSQTYVVPARVQPEDRGHPARRVRQRHQAARDLRPGVLEGVLPEVEPRPRRGGVLAGLPRLPDAADLVRGRHPVGSLGHGRAGRRRAQGGRRLVRPAPQRQ